MRTMPDDSAEPCGCGWCERESQEPSTPIEFDERAGTFFIRCRDGGTLRIHHCPFCGGAAPRFQRPPLFEFITHEERERLCEVVKGLSTRAEVIAKFGRPDSEASSIQAEHDTPMDRVIPELGYWGLSATADVIFREGDNGHISMRFQAKPIGRPERG